jgi:hypothetical protein
MQEKLQMWHLKRNCIVCFQPSCNYAKIVFVFSALVCEILLVYVWGFEIFSSLSSNGSLFISTSFMKNI